MVAYYLFNIIMHYLFLKLAFHFIHPGLTRAVGSLGAEMLPALTDHCYG